MRRLLCSLLAASLALALMLPASSQPASSQAAGEPGAADGLAELQRSTQQALADVEAELGQVAQRRSDPGWTVVQAGDGAYVQVDLDRVDELVPWVQLALAEQDAGPALLAAVDRYFPLAALAALATTIPEYELLRAGDIEAIDSDRIRSLIRGHFASAGEQQRKAQRYAALEAELRAQREALEAILELTTAALAEESAPVPEPTADASPAPDELDDLLGQLGLWDGCWSTNIGTLRLEESAGGRVDGRLVWVDIEDDLHEVTLEFRPLVGDYSDRLVGEFSGAPKMPRTDGRPLQFTCAEPRGGTDRWGTARLDYASGRSLRGSYLPCADADAFPIIPFEGTWDRTLQECDGTLPEVE